MNDNKIENQKGGDVEKPTLLEVIDKLVDVTVAVGQTSKDVTRMARADERVRKVKMVMLFLPIVIILLFYLGQRYASNPFNGQRYVSLVEINGEISKNNVAASAKSVIAGLQKAFIDNKSQGVFISIDSPGGSPAESAQIHDEIVALKEQYPDKKVIAFGIGSMTSGAYWIACAADEIHTLSMTMVGSIGVKMEAYDLSKIAKRLQISKYIFTAGENKVRLDPFSEPKQVDVEKFEIMLSKLHTLFKNTVLASRRNEIKEDEYVKVFSGDFWLGIEAVELGLIDSVTTQNKLLNEEFGTIHMLDYTMHPNVLDTLNQQRVLSDFVNFGSLLDIKLR